MKYKVGDKVKLKSKEGLDELKRQVGDLYIHPDAYKNAGSEQTILECSDEGFYCYDDSAMFWHERLFEGLVEEEVGLVDNLSSEWVNEFNLPNGYIFKDENGNVINATKIVLEKKKKEYPKSYEECVKCIKSVKEASDRAALLCKLERLLVCRDAYWKLYGEEMGLGKPWELSIGTSFYYIYYNRTLNTTKKDYADDIHGNVILAFPTKEMRDAFYENFKELIGQCKELL